MKAHRPLSRIDALPEDQRLQLADWILSETLAKTAELVKETYNLEIPQTTLHRFRKRCELTAYLDATDESSAARAELINAAATGKADFSAATLRLLERQMFELALDHSDPARHEALGDILGWIHKQKMGAVRERIAAVQEAKLKLRRQQFEKFSNSDHDAQIQELNEKIAAAFDQHPVLTAIRHAEEMGSAGVSPAQADVSSA